MGRKLIWGRLINYIHEFSLNSWESDGQELGWGGTLFIPDLGLVPLLFSKVSPSYAESPQSSKPLFFMHALPTCLQWQGAHNFIIQSPGKSVTIKAAFHPQLPSIFFFLSRPWVLSWKHFFTDQPVTCPACQEARGVSSGLHWSFQSFPSHGHSCLPRHLQAPTCQEKCIPNYSLC